MTEKVLLILLFILSSYTAYATAEDGYHRLEIEVEYINETMGAVDEAQKDALFSLVSGALKKFRKALSVKDTSRHVTVVGNSCGDPSRLTEGKVYKNVDYVLVVEVSTTKACKQGQSTLATASPCMREISTVPGETQMHHTRPIAGIMNICQHHFLNRREYQRKEWLRTIQHEMTHALVFHPNLLQSFQKPDGSFRRTGPSQPVPSPVEKNGSMTIIPGVLEEVVRNDWLTANGKINHKVYMLKTPKVVEEVRNYFNCPDLEGAEIESQGGQGTMGSHWEKRVFENEMMSGVSTQVFAFSNITLALFEDSGWYKVNYSEADSMSWGKGRGCDFVKKSCLDLIKSPTVKPFCTQNDPVHACSADRQEKLLCNLRRDNSPMSVHPAYTYGFLGSFEHPDHCPYYSKYEESRDAHSTGQVEPADSVCTHHGNMPKNSHHLLEIYSSHSRCFELAESPIEFEKRNGDAWTRKRSDIIGCFEHKCTNGTLWVKTRHSKFYPCYSEGQRVNVKKRLVNGNKVEFAIKCPSCQSMCSAQSCTAVAPVNMAYIGDKKNGNDGKPAIWICLILLSIYLFA